MKNKDSFLIEFMEYYPKLEIIESNEDCILAIDPNTKKAHYVYNVNEDLGFHFNLLCEVGQYYQSWFEYAIKKHHFKISPFETKDDYFEILVKH